MYLFVASSAQLDQVLFLVATCLAAEFEVMYLQVLHAPAELAPPAVSLQYLAVQLSIALRIKPDSWALAADRSLHDACRLTSD